MPARYRRKCRGGLFAPDMGVGSKAAASMDAHVRPGSPADGRGYRVTARRGSHITRTRGGNYFVASERLGLRSVSVFIIFLFDVIFLLIYRLLTVRGSKFRPQKRAFCVVLYAISRRLRHRNGDFPPCFWRLPPLFDPENAIIYILFF